MPNIKCTKSESSYMRGCRCEDCRESHTVKERERRKARAQKGKVESKGNGATTIRSTYEDSWTLQEILKVRGGHW